MFRTIKMATSQRFVWKELRKQGQVVKHKFILKFTSRGFYCMYENWELCCTENSIFRASNVSFWPCVIETNCLCPGPPGEPSGVFQGDNVGQDFNEIDPNKKYVRLYWSDGLTHGGTILAYTIEFRTNFDMTWRVHPSAKSEYCVSFNSHNGWPFATLPYTVIIFVLVLCREWVLCEF